MLVECKPESLKFAPDIYIEDACELVYADRNKIKPINYAREIYKRAGLLFVDIEYNKKRTAEFEARNKLDANYTRLKFYVIALVATQLAYYLMRIL